MAKVLGVFFSILIPDGGVEVVGGAEASDATTKHAKPVESVSVVAIITREVVGRRTKTGGIHDVAIAPVDTKGTHRQILREVLVMIVEDRKDGLRVGGIHDVLPAEKAPHYVAFHFPSVGVA